MGFRLLLFPPILIIVHKNGQKESLLDGTRIKHRHRSRSPLVSSNSALEQLTDGPLCLGLKKQRVANVVTDAWLATAGLRGGRRRVSCTSLPATLSSPLPPLIARVQYFVMDWAAEGRKSLLRREWGTAKIFFIFISPRYGDSFFVSYAVVRLRNKRLQTSHRPCYQLLRHQSISSGRVALARGLVSGQSRSLATALLNDVQEQLTDGVRASSFTSY